MTEGIPEASIGGIEEKLGVSLSSPTVRKTAKRPAKPRKSSKPLKKSRRSSADQKAHVKQGEAKTQPHPRPQDGDNICPLLKQVLEGIEDNEVLSWTDLRAIEACHASGMASDMNIGAQDWGLFIKLFRSGKLNI